MLGIAADMAPAACLGMPVASVARVTRAAQVVVVTPSRHSSHRLPVDLRRYVIEASRAVRVVAGRATDGILTKAVRELETGGTRSTRAAVIVARIPRRANVSEPRCEFHTGWRSTVVAAQAERLADRGH